jgi:hypothetical protein
MKFRMQIAVSMLIAIAIALFLAATVWSNGESTATLIHLAQLRVIGADYPVEHLRAREVTSDTGLFGFGGNATVRLESDGRLVPDGKPMSEPMKFRVELRRWARYVQWEVVSVTPER